MADLSEDRLWLVRLDATARAGFLPLIFDHSSRGKNAGPRRPSLTLRADAASSAVPGLVIAIEAAMGVGSKTEKELHHGDHRQLQEGRQRV
jgi:hypothetical protein